MQACWCVCAPFLMRDPQHRGAEGIRWLQKWSVLKSKKISSLWKSAAFPPLLFFKNTEWMHELLRASHHIPLLSPHVFHSCFWLVVVQKLRPPFLCEHMINSREHLTLSLHFFLTLVVSFSGEIDDTTQLSPVGVSLGGLLLWICTVTHVYEHAAFFLFFSIELPSRGFDVTFANWALYDWQVRSLK